MFIKKDRKNKSYSKNKKDYKLLFNNQYNLSCIARNIPWKLSSCIIKDNENVLLQGSYKLDTKDENGQYGLKKFHFYIIESGDNKYLKIVNVLSLEDQFDIGGILYSNGYENIPWCEEENYGVFTPEYKKYARKVTKEYLLDNHIENILKKMSKIDFKDCFLENFTCDYNISLIHYDCYDFYNKRIFCADGYCLEKYSAYIDLLDYIFSIANIKYLIPSPIKKIKSLDIAYEEMVKRKERKNEIALMIE